MAFSFSFKRLSRLVDAERNFEQLEAFVRQLGNRPPFVRGSVGSTGTVQQGQGWSVTRTGVGQYILTFNPPFAGVPSVTFSAGGTAGPLDAKHKDGATPTRSQVFVTTFNTSTTAAVDADFNFTAMGPA